MLGHLGCCIALSKQMEQVRAVPTDRKPMLSSGGKVSLYPVPVVLPFFHGRYSSVTWQTCGQTFYRFLYVVTEQGHILN